MPFFGVFASALCCRLVAASMRAFCPRLHAPVELVDRVALFARGLLYFRSGLSCGIPKTWSCPESGLPTGFDWPIPGALHLCPATGKVSRRCPRSWWVDPVKFRLRCCTRRRIWGWAVRVVAIGLALEEDVGPVALLEGSLDFGGRGGGAGTIGEFWTIADAVRPPPPRRPPSRSGTRGVARMARFVPSGGRRRRSASHSSFRFVAARMPRRTSAGFRLASRSLGRLPDDLLHFPRSAHPLGWVPAACSAHRVPVRDAARPARRLPRRHGAEVPDRRLDVGALARPTHHATVDVDSVDAAESSAERLLDAVNTCYRGSSAETPAGSRRGRCGRRPVQTAQAFHESRRGLRACFYQIYF